MDVATAGVLRRGRRGAELHPGRGALPRRAVGAELPDRPAGTRARRHAVRADQPIGARSPRRATCCCPGPGRCWPNSTRRGRAGRAGRRDHRTAPARHDRSTAARPRRWWSAPWPRSTTGIRASRSPSRTPAAADMADEVRARRPGCGVRRALRRPGAPPTSPTGSSPTNRWSRSCRRRTRPRAPLDLAELAAATAVRRDAGRVRAAPAGRRRVRPGRAWRAASRSSWRPPTPWCGSSGWASGRPSSRARPRRGRDVGVTVLELADPAARHPISLVHRRPEPSAPSARAFLRLLASHG